MRHFRKEHASHMNLWRNPDFMSSMVIRLDDDEQTTTSSAGGDTALTPETTSFLDISAPQERHVVVVPTMDEKLNQTAEKSLKTKRAKTLKGKTKKRKLSTISASEGISKDCDSIANDMFCENSSIGTTPSSGSMPINVAPLNPNATIISTPLSTKGYGVPAPPPLPPLSHPSQHDSPGHNMSAVGGGGGGIAPRRIVFDNRYQPHPQSHPHPQQPHPHGQPNLHPHVQQQQQQHPHQQSHPHPHIQQSPQQHPPPQPSQQQQQHQHHKPMVDWNCQPIMMAQQPHPPHHLNHHHPHHDQRRMSHEHHYYPHHLGGC